MVQAPFSRGQNLPPLTSASGPQFCLLERRRISLIPFPWDRVAFFPAKLWLISMPALRSPSRILLEVACDSVSSQTWCPESVNLT